MTNSPAPAPKKPSKKRNIAIITSMSLLVVGSFGFQAIAQSKAYQHTKLLFSHSQSDNTFIHNSNWRHQKGSKHARFFDMSDAEIENRVERIVKHVAIEIDATTEQQQKISTLVSALAKDMKPRREGFMKARDEVKEILLSQTVDRVALEKLRAERIAEMEKISKEVTTALADVAETLSFEQRQTLEKRINEFKSMKHRWRRG